jgi:hypothetical protein
MQPTAKRQAIYRARSGGSEPKPTSNDKTHLAHLHMGQSARTEGILIAKGQTRPIARHECTRGGLEVQIRIHSLIASALDRGY